jgi:hypothetical protein
MVDFYTFYTQGIQRGKLLVKSMIKIHHMVTLLLLALSWTQNLRVIGIFILFIHDLTDVPMFILRILRRKNAQFYKQVFSAIMVLWMWSYYRVWKMSQFTWGVIVYTIENPIISKQYPFYKSCIIGLIILSVFNIYWTGLVYKKFTFEIVGVKTDQEDE